MVNKVLDVHPPFPADIHITTRGSNWLWAVTAVLTVTALAIFGLSFKRPRTHRVFYYITGSIALVSAIAYFTKASNLGWTPVAVRYVRNNPKVRGFVRQIFYVRYIDWFITKPLIILAVLLTAAVHWSTILFTILLQWVFVITLLVGSLVTSRYKWGYFTFGVVAQLAVLYHILLTGRKHAGPLGPDVSRTYLTGAGIVAATWLLYPVAWGLSEGGNVIAPDSEHIFYGILDLLSKAVLPLLLAFGHNKIEPSRLGIHVRDFDDLPHSHRGGVVGEKHHHRNGVSDTPVVTTGVPAHTAV